MKFIWAAVLSLTAAWWFLTPLYFPPQWEGFLFLALGIFLFCLCAHNQITIVSDKKVYFLIPPSLLIAVLLPFPYNCGFILLISALLLRIPKHTVVRSIANSLTALSIVVIAQTVFFPLYYWLAPRFHEIQIFSPFLSALLTLAGVHTQWHQQNINMETANGIISLTSSFEKSGFDIALLFLIGAVAYVLILRRKNRLKTIGLLIALSGLYGMIRYALTILLFLYTNQMDLFWNRWYIVCSFIPLVLLLLRFLPPGEPAVLTLKIPHDKKNRTISLCMFASAFLLTFGLLFQDPGLKKQGRVLLDEKHSNWEWTTQKFDTTWYGEKSSYNYYCLYNLISQYYHVERNFAAISAGILNRYDILIIKTPTSSFSADEIQAITAFVEQGGSLFLIGDHTNVFGTSSCLNPIAQQYGFRYRYDATYDLPSGKLTFYKPMKFLTHPVFQNVDYLLFGTSCSLNADVLSESVINGYGLKSMAADYSRRNFFPDGADSPGMSFGIFTQMAGVKHGKGRVLLFTDSTIWSNFWIFMSGKPELFLGSLNWLNRKNFLAFMNPLLVLAGLGFVVLMMILRKKYQIDSLLILTLLWGTPGVGLGIFSTYALNRLWYALPPPHTKFTTVAFDMEHSTMELPDKELNENAFTAYATFYVWTQRINLFPRTEYSFDKAIKNADILCVVNPKTGFSDPQLSKLFEFVSNGGKLLVLDQYANSESTANQVLQMFSMRFDRQLWAQPVSCDTSHQILSVPPSYLSLYGGTTILTGDKGYRIAGSMQVGKGEVIAFSESQLFCDAAMGNTNSFPNQNQLVLFKIEYNLFDKFSH